MGTRDHVGFARFQASILPWPIGRWTLVNTMPCRPNSATIWRMWCDRYVAHDLDELVERALWDVALKPAGEFDRLGRQSDNAAAGPGLVAQAREAALAVAPDPGLAGEVVPGLRGNASRPGAGEGRAASSRRSPRLHTITPPKKFPGEVRAE